MPKRVALASRKSWNDEIRNAVFEKGAKVRGKDSFRFRKDKYGNIIRWDAYGKNVPQGWHVDHKKPLSKGGSNNLSNLQPLQWEDNLAKGAKVRWNPWKF